MKVEVFRMWPTSDRGWLWVQVLCGGEDAITYYYNRKSGVLQDKWGTVVENEKITFAIAHEVAANGVYK